MKWITLWSSAAVKYDIHDMTTIHILWHVGHRAQDDRVHDHIQQLTLLRLRLLSDLFQHANSSIPFFFFQFLRAAGARASSRFQNVSKRFAVFLSLHSIAIQFLAEKATASSRFIGFLPHDGFLLYIFVLHFHFCLQTFFDLVFDTWNSCRPKQTTVVSVNFISFHMYGVSHSLFNQQRTRKNEIETINTLTKDRLKPQTI